MKKESLENWQIHFLNYIEGIDQQSFLNQATPISNLSIRSSADIYKRGYKARLIESLGETFQATWWVLGDEDYLKLAEEFVKKNPSRSYDLSDYGNEFPAFLKSSSTIGEIPFISELARFEWNFKFLFHSADAPNAENFLNRLSQDPNMKLHLPPSTILWKSDFPIYNIWKRREGPISSLNDINLDIKEYLLCRKLNGTVHITHLEEPEFQLLQQFESPSSIDEAVNHYQKFFGELNIESIQNLFSRIGALGVLSS